MDVHSLGVGRGSAETDFVPRKTPSEDDGWLMSYAYDAATDSSEFVVLDALDVKAGRSPEFLCRSGFRSAFTAAGSATTQSG